MLSAAITNRSNSDFIGSIYQKRSLKGRIDGTRFEDVFIRNDKEEKTEEYSPSKESQECETNTNIIVKPDGSRVLVVTMNIGGMETTMSLEISKPTEFANGHTTEDAITNELNQGNLNDSEAMINQFRSIDFAE